MLIDITVTLTHPQSPVSGTLRHVYSDSYDNTHVHIFIKPGFFLESLQIGLVPPTENLCR